jgi:hypothetical protein
MQFNFSYAPELSLDQTKGFELAGKIWSSYLKDNVTINIAVDIQKDFPSNAIAGSAPRLNTQKFDAFQKSLESDATSANDRLAIQSASLTNKSFTGRFNDGSGNNGNGNGNGRSESRDSTQLNVNSANAKALDLSLKGDSSLLDGYIVMRDLKGAGVSWDYDFARTGDAPSKTLDFLSVAIHEIGHILGFQSSVDRPGWVNPNSNSGKSDDFKKNLDERAKSVTPLDLFRYSERSKLDPDKNGVRPVAIDLAIGGNPYLSVKNGDSPIASFDTGTDTSQGGSGNQASHWKSSGIMNAVLNQGSRPTISSADLTALDVIGYDLATQGASAPNYAQLLQQVTQSLAQRLGKTVDWLNANPTADVSKLTEDVTDATSEMLDNSSVYKKKDLTFWTTGARGGRWWQGFKQTFMEEGIFETLGDDSHNHEHDHDGDDLSGEIVDLLTGLPGNAQILNGASLDSFFAQDFGADLLDELVLGQLPSDFDLGSFDLNGIPQTILGNGAITSWLQQNSNNLTNLSLLENSTNGGNPIYDLGVNV